MVPGCRKVLTNGGYNRPARGLIIMQCACAAAVLSARLGVAPDALDGPNPLTVSQNLHTGAGGLPSGLAGHVRAAFMYTTKDTHAA